MRSPLHHFFGQIMADDIGDPSPGLSIYRRQIRSRLIITPASHILFRCQKIWGQEFLLDLLVAYYQTWPPRSFLWEETLEQLPAFVQEHPEYSRVFALYDLIVLCLKTWACLHGPDPILRKELDLSHPLRLTLSKTLCFHFPQDSLNLFQLWEESQEETLERNESTWKRWASGPHQGIISIKQSCDQILTMRLLREELPLMESLQQGCTLQVALTQISKSDLETLLPILPGTLSLWQQGGLFQNISL